MSVLYARLLFQPILCHILLGKELQNSSCNRIVDSHYLLQIMNEYLHNLVYIVKKYFKNVYIPIDCLFSYMR